MLTSRASAWRSWSRRRTSSRTRLRSPCSRTRCTGTTGMSRPSSARTRTTAWKWACWPRTWAGWWTWRSTPTVCKRAPTRARTRLGNTSAWARPQETLSYVLTAWSIKTESAFVLETCHPTRTWRVQRRRAVAPLNTLLAGSGCVFLSCGAAMGMTTAETGPMSSTATRRFAPRSSSPVRTEDAYRNTGGTELNPKSLLQNIGNFQFLCFKQE